MKRRIYLQTILAGACAIASRAASKDRPIQLHVDLSVDPGQEREMLHNFHTVFRPAASKQPGFVDVKMLKLRSPLAGAAPAGANYRFELTFASEEQRQAWVATATHQQVWPTIEKTLASKNYTILLYDEV
jgi:antibiotic biosynthesis monooxygenase (ABM) superfamily enzyme